MASLGLACILFLQPLAFTETLPDGAKAGVSDKLITLLMELGHTRQEAEKTLNGFSDDELAVLSENPQWVSEVGDGGTVAALVLLATCYTSIEDAGSSSKGSSSSKSSSSSSTAKYPKQTPRPSPTPTPSLTPTPASGYNQNADEDVHAPAKKKNQKWDVQGRLEGGYK